MALTRLEAVSAACSAGTTGRVVTAERPRNGSVGPVAPRDRHSLKQIIYRLRHKLEANPLSTGRLQTSRGSGYRWRTDEAPARELVRRARLLARGARDRRVLPPLGSARRAEQVEARHRAARPECGAGWRR